MFLQSRVIFNTSQLLEKCNFFGARVIITCVKRRESVLNLNICRFFIHHFAFLVGTRIGMPGVYSAT